MINTATTHIWPGGDTASYTIGTQISNTYVSLIQTER